MTRFLKSVALPSEGLGWVRRGLAFLCLLDSLLRLPSARFFLSDLGVLPRSTYYAQSESSYAWSVYMASGWVEASLVLLALTVLISLAHLAGRSRRASRLLLWVLVASVQARNPTIVDASDDLLRLLLFWDIFLPSVHSGEGVRYYATPATLGLQLQLTIASLFVGVAFSPDYLALVSQWSGSAVPGLVSPLVRLTLGLLVVAIWWSRARGVLVTVVLCGLAVAGYFLHYSLPLTLGVASLCLLSRPGSEQGTPKVSGRLPGWIGVALLALLSVGLNVAEAPGLRGPLVAIAQGLAFEQDWSGAYPLAGSRVAELVARNRGGGQPLWFVSYDSSRRERLFAQRVAEDPAWAGNLGRGLMRELEIAEPELWLTVEEIPIDLRLGRVEVRLLSRTPVTSYTERVLKP